jgi:uncharacterized membrane protein YraQ (UPF0718 family)
MKQKRGTLLTCILLACFLIMLLISWKVQWSPGIQIAAHSKDFFGGMLRIFPCAFMLIGLFEVWVKKETVQRHMGESAGWQGYIWALLLAGTTVGGMFVAFPMAYTLHTKGAKLGIIFTYVGAAAICRVPMTLFEASYLGGIFTLVRFAVSLPLVILTSAWLGHWLSQGNYQIKEGHS